MNALNLVEIERCSNQDEITFNNNYFKKQKPVIITDYSKGWPATNKWDFEYLKSVAGNITVPLFEEAFAEAGKGYMTPKTNMPFSEYLDLIAQNETKMRMFLFNIYQKIPHLCNDFSYPPLTRNYATKYPFIFFGGKDAHVGIHYDADLSNLFLTQFHGKKYIILFEPKYTPYLYHNIFTVSTNVDFRAPDFQRYPKLKEALGYECTLSPHETLFIPSGYWHYIYYVDSGFSLTLRTPPKGINKKIQGYLNILNLLVIDYGLTKILGKSRWNSLKEKIANSRANKAIL